MTDCVFCEIVQGTAPAVVFHEDQECIAILDINPATDGHALVIPRVHYSDLLDIPEDLASAAMRTAHAVATRLDSALKPAGFNLMHATRPAAWQTVFHFHVHVVPRYPDDNLVPPWPLDHRAGLEDLKEMAEKIRQHGQKGPKP